MLAISSSSLNGANVMRVRPHPGQAATLRSEAFCTAAIAGTGGGKTVTGFVWLPVQMVLRPGQMWLAAEPTDEMLERNFLVSTQGRPSLLEVLRRLDPNMVYLSGERVIRHRLGTVYLASAFNPDVWQGGHLAGVWLDEAGLMKYAAWLTAVQRVGYLQGKVLITTTPYNKGWLKFDVYDRWMDGDADYNVVRFPSTANPKFPVAAMERAKRIMSAARFDMLYKGEFGRPEGMVYDCFEATRDTVEPFDVSTRWQRWGGVDFGWNHPTAALTVARDGDGVYYVVAEHYEREMGLARHAAVLKAGGGQAWSWYYDPSAPQQAAELRRGGLVMQPAVNDVQAGIDTVYALFKTGRLKVFRTCKHLIDELEGYTWRKRSNSPLFEDEPVKEHDDAVDALRYVLHSVEAGPRLSLAT